MHSLSQGASAVEGRVRGSDAKRLRLAKLPVGIAFSAFILIGGNDGALGVLIPSMRLHYSVDKATIGLLFLFQTIGYLIAAFNSGLLVEKLGNRRFLVSGVASFLLGVGALSLMPSFVIVLIMLLPLGFGVASIDAGLNTYIASMPRRECAIDTGLFGGSHHWCAFDLVAAGLCSLCGWSRVDRLQLWPHLSNHDGPDIEQGVQPHSPKCYWPHGEFRECGCSRMSLVGGYAG